ncbi:cyclase family protein [Chloroflexota bacterium]
MKLVDLSYEFYPGLYLGKYPEADVEIRTLRAVEKDGVNMMRISFGNHVGTHIDGPRHIITEAETLDELPLELFYGTAVVLDLPRGANEAIGQEDLLSARPAIKGGDIVLLRTGWDAKFPSQDYHHHHPYLSEDGATFLVDKNVRLVGIDATSVDLPSPLRKEGFRHTSLRILLQNRIPVIHGLRNLKSVAGKRVTLMALPIRFRGADSAPARVVALAD